MIPTRKKKKENELMKKRTKIHLIVWKISKDKINKKIHKPRRNELVYGFLDY